MDLTICPALGPKVGFGHAVRCLALAEAAAKGGRAVTLLLDGPRSFVHRRAEAHGISVADRVRPATLGSWLVVDGVDPGAVIQDSRPALLVVIDDIGDQPWQHADLVLNQNPHASPHIYCGAAVEKLLLGPAYALLREEFCRIEERIVAEEVGTILVSLGGSDPTGQLLKVTTATRSTGCEVLVLVGREHPDERRLLELDGVEVNIGLEDPSPVMRRADLAVTSAGTSVFELSAVGVPLVVGSVNGLEDAFLAGLEARSLAATVGRLDEWSGADLAQVIRDIAGDRQRRAELVSRAQRLVDGRGAYRVLDAMDKTMRDR